MRVILQRFFLVASDALLLNVAVVLAFLIRFDGELPGEFFAGYEKVAPLFTLLSIALFFFSGLYSSLWRYASLHEGFLVLRGTLLSSVALAGLTHGLPYMARLTGWSSALLVEVFPRSVLILAWLLTTMLIGGIRFSFRSARYVKRRWQEQGVRTGIYTDQRTLRRVVIVGAGEAGSLVAKELETHASGQALPVGFVDDDTKKQGMKVHGLPVLGTTRSLSHVIKHFGIDEIIIAMPSAPGRVIREIVHNVQDLRVKVKTLPGIYELLDGTVSIQQIRDVQIEDLLGREPVNINLDEVAGYLEGERVLVTGAGGSIGAELCRQVAQFSPAELLLLDVSENGVVETSLDISYRYPHLATRTIVADIRDPDKIMRVFAANRPGVVFHAAAYKHVPVMEGQPDEAVKTNVLGTRNVAQAALRYKAKKFILVSTDKAVNPSSVMGCTKRVAEMVVQALDSESRECRPRGPKFAAVRFGNVLGSRGSVVPIFKDQIARGGPVTITHPDMRRYFMTIPEASQLVIQAGALAEGGEVFILDMGEPVRVMDLAENLIRLSGFEPGVDIPIQITGVRPGEKLFEELLTSEEGADATSHKRIFVGRIPKVDPNDLELRLSNLGRAVRQQVDDAQVVLLLSQLVPEFPSTPSGTRPGTDRPLVVGGARLANDAKTLAR